MVYYLILILFVGDSGHLVSNMLKNYFSSFFSKESNFLCETARSSSLITVKDSSKWDENHIYKKLIENNYELIYKAFADAQEQLSSNKFSESKFFGSTGTLVFIVKSRMISANIGDSRGILTTKQGSQIVFTEDHVTYHPRERERIYLSGGNIVSQRVIYKSTNFPNLLTTRGFGDLISKSIGIITTPYINEIEITEEHKGFIIACGAFYESIYSQDITSTFSKYSYNCLTLVSSLIDQAVVQAKQANKPDCEISLMAVLFNNEYHKNLDTSNSMSN